MAFLLGIMALKLCTLKVLYKADVMYLILVFGNVIKLISVSVAIKLQNFQVLLFLSCNISFCLLIMLHET